MLGTAFPAARLLLVEEPYPWGPEGLRTSRFDRATALALEARGRAQGVRVQAVRRLGRALSHRDRSPRQWVLVDTRPTTRTVLWGEFTHDAELLELPLDGSQGRSDPTPLYLVCTHGRHDPCCAARGRPVAAALETERSGQVWQASHLGGCRFAATVLVLPLGLMYGRVSSSAASRLAAATDAGEIVGPLLRGRIGIAPAAQAALGFAHEQLSLSRVDDISLVASAALDPSTVRVCVETLEGRYEITVARDRVDAVGLTCGASGPSWFIAHHPIAMERVEDG